MSDLLIIGIVVAFVIAGWFAYPYLKKIGVIKEGNIDGARQALEIAQLIIAVVSVDQLTKNRIKFILDMADSAVNYVAGLADPDVDKKSLSLEVIDHVLKQLSVVPTPQEQALIERLIAEVLNIYRKQQKAV